MDFLLPHQATFSLIIAALLGLLVGFTLWLRGYKSARLVLTVLLTAAGALWGYIAPHYWHNVPVAIVCSVLVGVTGAILGYVAFRLMQAVLVALLAVLLVAGVMAHNAGAFAKPPPPHKNTAAENLAAHALDKAQPAAQDRAWKYWQQGYHEVQYRWRQFDALPVKTLKPIKRAAIATGIVVLALGLFFAKPCSLVSTSWIGGLLGLWSLGVLAEWLKPGSPKMAFKYIPEAQLIVAVGVLGTLLQLVQVWMSGHKAKKKTAEEKKA